MKVPFYENRDRNATYENNNYKWVNLDLFLNIINTDIINEFGSLSAFHLDNIDHNEWKNKLENKHPISLEWDNFVEFNKFVVASKVLFTTGFTCEYGLWTKWTWNHHWIDLILPKNTPIISFTEWEVVRIKKWDGTTKNEWNCIVIKSNINGEELYFSYEHLEDIDVKMWDIVKKWDKIWTCGSTWNSTTNHLHFQIDNNKAPFHPFWSRNILETNKNCIDPWTFLQKHYKTEEIINNEETTNHNNNTENTDSDDIITDLISNIDNSTNNEDYVSFFKNVSILKWEYGNLYLNNPLTRYQFSLILYRLSKKWFFKIKENNCDIYFADTQNINEEEFKKSLKLIVCSQIMKWENKNFYPWKQLSWEQFLAIMWRLFANLDDNQNGIWYENYLSWAKQNKIIDSDWEYIWKNITRNEVFKILYKLLFLDEIV